MPAENTQGTRAAVPNSGYPPTVPVVLECRKAFLASTNRPYCGSRANSEPTSKAGARLLLKCAFWTTASCMRKNDHVAEAGADIGANDPGVDGLILDGEGAGAECGGFELAIGLQR